MKGSTHPQAGINLAFGGGMAAIILYVVCSTAAWWVYPDRFTPLKNWLSDLGDRSRNPQGAPFYNVGCILTAAALLLFVLGLSRWRSEHQRRNALIVASQLAAFGSIVFLVMLGLYSQERLHEHLIYSNWFFVCFSLFMALLSAALITDPHFKKSVGILGFAVVLVSFAFHSLFPLSRPLEWMTEFGFLVYVALVALNTQRALTIGTGDHIY